MSDPRDPVETWLGADVELMPPAPGTFEQVHRRARRRKAGTAMAAAACAAVLIAGAAVLPQVARGLLPGGSGPDTVAGGTTTPARTHSSHPPAGSPRPSPSGSRTAGSAGPPLTSAGSGKAPAAGFAPTSVTFISGGALGAVLGHSGSGCTSGQCAVMAATANYGQTWTTMGAPHADTANGESGVSQIRFLDAENGWAFGPALYATHDGGKTWHQDPLPGRVVDLSTVNHLAFAVVAQGCTGGGADYFAHCTSFALWETAPGLRQWRTVAGAHATAPAAPGGLQLTGEGGYLVEGGHLFAGPVSPGPWHAVLSRTGRPPCLRSPGQSAAQEPAVLAPDGSELYLACDAAPAAGRATGPLTLYLSADSGRRWNPLGPVAAQGTAASLTAIPGGGIVLATSSGLYYSPDGASWQTASVSAPVPAGFSYVGLTTAGDGVAVPARSGLGEVFTTSDGGQTWQADPISR